MATSVSAKEQGQYTHIVLLLDASTSMEGHTDAVVRVVDQLVSEWTEQALALDDMTRLTIYQFSSDNYMPNGSFIECITYDTDIARIKSLKGRYRPEGATALIEATLHAQRELALTPTMHGDHTFLLYAITDGANNRGAHLAGELERVLTNLPDNWTVAALVPNIHGKIAAQRYGFPPGNIMQWDTTEKGVEEVGRQVAAATATYMQSRTNTGLRSTKSLFVGGQVDATVVKRNLKPLPSSDYHIVPVVATPDMFEHKTHGKVVEIKKFVDHAHPPYRVGMAYYQLFTHGKRRSEKIQGNKAIAVMDKKNSKVYVGEAARHAIGLPDHDVTIKADTNPDYEIFVQSSSTNRHLPIGTKLLIMK